MRRVFHEKALPQPMEETLPEPSVPIAPPIEKERAAATDSRPLSYQPNYVRLNLKRHLNVKHPVHRRAKDEERVSSQQQLQNSGSGPGLLEEEVFDVLAEKVYPSAAVSVHASSSAAVSVHASSSARANPPNPSSNANPPTAPSFSQATPPKTTPSLTSPTHHNNGNSSNTPLTHSPSLQPRHSRGAAHREESREEPRSRVLLLLPRVQPVLWVLSLEGLQPQRRDQHDQGDACADGGERGGAV